MQTPASTRPYPLALKCLFAICLAASSTAAQNAPAELHVIPQPKQMRASGETFKLDAEARIVLADPKSEDDFFAARDFADDVRATCGTNLGIGGRGRGKRILIGTLDRPAVREAVERAGLRVPENLNAEGYLLATGTDGAVVAGRTAAGTFYGLQTLKQLVRGDGAGAYIQGARITDYPTMRWRGVSDDISRGPVPTIDYIKRQLRTLAMFKVNMHSLYMEHVFASQAHPLIAPEGGSLKGEEIRELVAYAKRLHIELVPEQQTFGHLHKALKFERYNELAEVPYGDVLSPQQEGGYRFVADLYKEIDAAFPGKFFHIGADETFELGRGQSREAAQARGVGSIYFEHLDRVRTLLKPYNRELMFWGDIALSHPELIGRIPKDLIVMNWAYSPRETYSPRIKPFADAGLRQFICPGVNNWNQVFPNIDAARANIGNFTRDGQAAGVLGMMNTSWDDDGETLFEMTWYGHVLGAAAAWQPAPVDLDRFDRDYDWAFFRTDGDKFVGVTKTLGGINTLLGAGELNSLFWREPLTSGFQKTARDLRDKTKEMRLRVEAAEEILIRDAGSARRNRETLTAMRFAARHLDHLGRRMQVVEALSRDYWDAYLNLGDRTKVRPLRIYSGSIYNSLREMAEEMVELRAAYRTQWLAENRPYWLDSVTARYDLAINDWLAGSRKLREALRRYDETSRLPDPEEFGLGTRPAEPKNEPKKQ